MLPYRPKQTTFRVPLVSPVSERLENLGAPLDYVWLKAPRLDYVWRKVPRLYVRKNEQKMTAKMGQYHKTYFLGYNIIMLSYRPKKSIRLYHKQKINFKPLYLLMFICLLVTRLKIQLPS